LIGILRFEGAGWPKNGKKNPMTQRSHREKRKTKQRENKKVVIVSDERKRRFLGKNFFFSVFFRKCSLEFQLQQMPTFNLT